MPKLPDHLLELAARVSNRGRWGDDDRRGTLNLLTPEAVRRGAASVRQGRSFSLAIPFDEDGPQTGGIPGRDNPSREMIAVDVAYTGDPDGFCTSDDRVAMGVQAATHWDALAHVGYSGELYNGVPSSVVSAAGAAELGIDAFGPVAGRGVLLDVARLHGVDHFDDGYPITGDDLDAAAAAAGLTVEAGDLVLVRTGHMHFLRIGEKDRYREVCPGLSTRSIEWFHDHDVAGVATDTLVLECFPCEDPAVLLPVHMIHLRDLGLAQGQLWHLDDLAADCAADGQFDFLLTATPIPLTRGLGGMVAPTAVK
ncbi:cyclase family protein [Aquihabitans sp. G128]|uniref:cyclase family protein n=1 Tax=Aquihabitans sp. G128 TaxID=2849779 RepID=UPI001C237ED8|nr:cyclase family protein [Aquihabitans sp. G128]QXC62805.1 cyclase family protein [Aquihabitans sp. G128]